MIVRRTGFRLFPLWLAAGAGIAVRAFAGDGASLPPWTPAEGETVAQMLFQPGTGIDAPPDPAQWEAVRTPFLWTEGTGRVVPPSGRPPAAWLAKKPGLSRVDSGWFERRLALPADWAGRRVWLALDQVECDALVWIDDKPPVFVQGPEGRVDLTGLATPGKEATLRLWVTRWWKDVPLTLEQDPIRRTALLGEAGASKSGEGLKAIEALRPTIPGGLSGAVRIEVRPREGELTGVFARPSWREKALDVDVEARIASLPGAVAHVEVADPDGAGGAVPPPADVPLGFSGDGTATVRLAWEHPRPWQMGDGYRYALKVSLRDAQGKTLQALDPVRFGFREVWASGKDLLMNGRPLRLRQAPVIAPQWPSLLFWEGIGFNAMEWHPNPGSWYLSKGRRSLIVPEKDNPGLRSIAPDVVEHADAEGFALLMPAPKASSAGNALADPAVAAAYERECRLWFRRLRNHPSILVWMAAMNTGSFSRENPERIGTDPRPDDAVAPWYRLAEEIVRKVDPTRLVCFHDGHAGDVDYPNQYLNFMALQERIEFPSQWAEKGERPWGAIEHGTPWIANFFKWHLVPLFTEFHAMYFGDRAYAREGDAYVDLVAQAAQRKAGHVDSVFTCDELARVGDMTDQYEWEELFTRETNRAWRAYGVAGGWKPWTFQIGLGVPPAQQGRTNKGGYFYTELSEAEARASIAAAPDWANPIYRAYRETMQPLLVFLGGPAARFTAKDHAFFSGEKFEKSLVAVWDGNDDRPLSAEWTLLADGKPVQQGTDAFVLHPGDIAKRPISLAAPAVAARTEGELRLTVRDASGAVVCREAFPLAFWPRADAAPAAKARWALYDPAGKSAGWLRSLGVQAEPVRSVEEVRRLRPDVLVVGREAFGHQAPSLPFAADDVAAGLRVLVLEQKPDALESIGLRIQDMVARQAFPRDRNDPALAGLQEADLRDWRGEADLLPRTSEGMKKWPLARPPHWGNQGAVASVTIETPHAGAFTPLAEAGFDLAYSPLLEWRHGKGGIVFSLFDLTGRVGADPAATRLAANLVARLDAPYAAAQDRTVRYVGDAAGWDYVRALGFDAAQAAGSDLAALRPDADLLVVGPGAWAGLAPQADSLRRFVVAGGAVLVLPQKGADLAAGTIVPPLATGPVRAARASAPSSSAPLVRGIGPQELHWRTFLTQDRFVADKAPSGAAVLLDGLALDLPAGSGRWAFSQLDWRPLDDGSWNLEKPRWNVMKFHRQLLANLGARTEAVAARRLCAPSFSAPLVDVPAWKVMSKAARIDPRVVDGKLLALGDLLPFEKPAAGGADDGASAAGKETVGEGELANPGVALGKTGWVTFSPRASDAMVHLNWISPPEVGKVGYARSWVHSSRERQAVFAVGADYWMIFRINGQAVVDHSRAPRAAHAPFAREFQFVAPLHAGWNLLEAKVASGSDSFGFWCMVSDPGDAAFAASLGVPGKPPAASSIPLLPEPDIEAKEPFYVRPLLPDDDPYRFNPW